jgi:hypothetical protein
VPSDKYKKKNPLSDALKMAIEHIKNTLIRKEVAKAVDQIPIDWHSKATHKKCLA